MLEKKKENKLGGNISLELTSYRSVKLPLLYLVNFIGTLTSKLVYKTTENSNDWTY
jgi:hypothetical protein